MSIKVGSTQFSYKYGKQLHMPYTIAILVSYLKSNETIRNNFMFLPTAVDREDFDKFVELYKDIDILLCSCYIWNWEITQKFTQKVKEINPKCLVIYGGPQIPEDSEDYFKNHDFVDLFVHNEGEIVLTNIFLEHLENKNYDNIKSVSTRNSPKWLPESIIKDVNTIPSPYITGLIWDLIDKDANVIWLGIMETVRGCPYTCAYCAWGAASYSKVRKFEVQRVFKEIDFFSDNKLTYIDCSDANFGMFERDVQITDYIVQKKKTTGYPTSFKPCWDKRVNDRIKYIAKELKSVDLLISVGCSLQTLDPEALKVNRRTSVSFEEFVNLTDHFQKDGSQCYTEIIRGLPGETLQSFKNGLDKVIYNSNVDTVFIYNCSSYEATELNDKNFKEKYNVKVTRSPVFLSHATLNKTDIPEFDDIVTASYSFTTEELEMMWLYSWYMLIFQFLGLSKWITKYLKNEKGIGYEEFFSLFVKYCENHPESLFGKEWKEAKKHAQRGFQGLGWDHLDPQLGPINWPMEEASWLRLVADPIDLKLELLRFLIKSNIKIDVKLEDLINFQAFTLSMKTNVDEYVCEEFQYDWKHYFTEGHFNENNELILYTYKNKIPKFIDNFDWNTKCIWFGRRKVNYKAKLEEISYGQKGTNPQISCGIYSGKTCLENMDSR